MKRKDYTSSLDAIEGIITVTQGNAAIITEANGLLVLPACKLELLYESGDIEEEDYGDQLGVYLTDTQIRDLIAMLQEYLNAD